MDINLDKLQTLWYENKNGDKWVPNDLSNFPDDDTYCYQISESPCELRTNYFKFTLASDVSTCDHPNKYISPTYGWIDGIVGRQCSKCGGTQTKKETEEWPDIWNDNGGKSIAYGTSSWPQDLVLALSRPSLKERLISLGRGYWNRYYDLDKAILIAAHSCERCLNSLAYQYGLSWGYKEFSVKWDCAGTSCEFCTNSLVLT